MFFSTLNSSKLLDKANQRTHQTKTRSADVITGNKTKPPPPTTTTIVTSSNDVKVENVSPDTSPVHHTTTSSNTTDKTTATQIITESQHHNGTTNRRAKSDTDREKISRKPKKEPEDVAAAVKGTAVKGVPQVKEKHRVTGYAARYSQQRKVAENSNKTIEKEMVNASRVLDFDRPLLSPATKESMAKKRRCSEKLCSTESSSQDASTTATSISAPVRRSKQSGSLGSGEIVWLLGLWLPVY